MKDGHILIKAATHLGHMKLPYFHSLWIVSPGFYSQLLLLPLLACLVQKKIATLLRRDMMAKIMEVLRELTVIVWPLAQGSRDSTHGD